MGSSVARPTTDRTAMNSLVSTLRRALQTLCIALLFATVLAGAALADQFADGHAAYLRGDIDTALALWTPLAEGGHLRETLDSGDGAHVNDAGHKLLADVVIAANIPEAVLQTP